MRALFFTGLVFLSANTWSLSASKLIDYNISEDQLSAPVFANLKNAVFNLPFKNFKVAGFCVGDTLNGKAEVVRSLPMPRAMDIVDLLLSPDQKYVGYRTFENGDTGFAIRTADTNPQNPWKVFPVDGTVTAFIDQSSKFVVKSLSERDISIYTLEDSGARLIAKRHLDEIIGEIQAFSSGDGLVVWTEKHLMSFRTDSLTPLWSMDTSSLGIRSMFTAQGGHLLGLLSVEDHYNGYRVHLFDARTGKWLGVKDSMEFLNLQLSDDGTYLFSNGSSEIRNDNANVSLVLKTRDLSEVYRLVYNTVNKAETVFFDPTSAQIVHYAADATGPLGETVELIDPVLKTRQTIEIPDLPAHKMGERKILLRGKALIVNELLSYGKYRERVYLLKP